VDWETIKTEVATLRCEPSGKEIKVVHDTNLLDALLQIGVPVSQACDGVALCGFCRVEIITGEENLTPLSNEERKILASLHADDHERLACCTRILGPVTLTTDYWS
jgi:ferredoxin